MEFTSAMIGGFFVGLGIAFISLIVLVILGAKAIQSGKYFNYPQDSDSEIT